MSKFPFSDHYPGDPSEKFLEEKLKLSEIIRNMKQIEEAIPLLSVNFSL